MVLIFNASIITRHTSSLSTQFTPVNFAHASWTTSRCATHRLVVFPCYWSLQTGKDCPKLVNTISILSHINSYQFHLNFIQLHNEYYTFLQFEVLRLMIFSCQKSSDSSSCPNSTGKSSVALLGLQGSRPFFLLDGAKAINHVCQIILTEASLKGFNFFPHDAFQNIK